MRIIAGQLGGRQFDSPGGHKTHPMAERVRGGIFNALGDVSGLRVLDVFAGSGALGLEALSRGAAAVTFVESDRLAQQVIEQNCQRLGVVDRSRLERASVKAWLSRNTSDPFDVVFCDPPYDHLQLETIGCLTDRLTVDGILVLSMPGKGIVPSFPGLQSDRVKQYGDAQVIFYRR